MNHPLGLILVSALVAVGAAGCQPDIEPTRVSTCEDWSYDGETGPAQWASLCSPTCAGDRQSPVDIVTASVVDANAESEAEPILFEYGETELTLFNNGHTIEEGDEHVEKENAITVGGTRFELLQIHFHSLSEHTIDGAHSPLEMHLVHRNEDARLAVIGVMIQEGAPNEALAAVWDQLPTLESSPHVEVHVDVEDVLPENRAYYQYDGSLTTPNGSNPAASCAEIVNWLVMKEAITMSADQIAAFQAIFDHNYRPVQPLNGRTIYGH
ncbi:MAG: carbonic anhydrase family protein [Rhodothermales bacterium]